MSLNYSSLHKRNTSLGYSKQRRTQSKTPNGSSSLSFDLSRPRLTNDKLNLSNVLSIPEQFSAALEANPNSSFNYATLSSAAKTKSKNSNEANANATQVFFLNSKSGQASSRSGVQKILFPVQEKVKGETLGQAKEIQNSLWDSPRSFLENNQESSPCNEEQANQESSNTLKSNGDPKKKDVIDLTKYGSNDFGTIKTLKEMIHKLQLKDAIQRQEITKLKRINEKIQKESRVFEERARSLERISNKDCQNKSFENYSSQKRKPSEKTKQFDTNTSFQEGNSYDCDKTLGLKTLGLMQQIEHITYEKSRLEETLKDLLLDRELSRTDLNANICEMQPSPANNTLTKATEQKTWTLFPDKVYPKDIQPFSGVQTPQEASKRSSSVGRASARPLSDQSVATPKRNSHQKSNEQPTEKKTQIRGFNNLSSRENSPSAKAVPQSSTSQRGARMSAIDLIFNVNPTYKKEQTPRLNSNRNSPARDRYNVRKESPTQEKKERKDYQLNNVLSIDCNPRKFSVSDLKNNGLNDSSITPVKALPLFSGNQTRDIKENTISHCEQERSFLNESGLCSDKDTNSSYLNNVSPAVLDIILQHQKNHKPSSRNSSISNYFSGGSHVPSSLNETYSTKLNLEHLFASNGREKENRKNNPEKIDNSSTPLMSTVNALCQGLAHVKIDPQTVPKQMQSTKKSEALSSILEDKASKKNPLDEISFAQKLSCKASDIQSQNQSYINDSFQGPNNINIVPSTSSVCPVILSAQPQGRVISSKRAQLALETLRAKMQKRDI